MRLKTGDSAKEFTVKDYLGKTIQLADLKGKYTLLAFFRNAECALCNLRVHQLLNVYPELQKKGLGILAVFESSEENIKNSVGKKEIPFSLIPDPSNRLYKLYDVERSWLGVISTILTGKKEIKEAEELGFEMKRVPGMKMDRMPAEFLIGPDLRIEIAKFSKKVTDHISLEDLKAYLN
ncbi:redoxin domain-containing protein [Leptospira sp. 201903070]|jgi:thioredoxin-dependent peroxiredoxin|uniref:Redoxin domain-containing protein n=1 Tax=Leptospira ainlahdjerensis TaxID=2810033 RepID=A0ABS2UG18_9LEPT|nr:redoxin domain-containing protein [Leptospira ainlahdjerensis]MBM9579314.1 redoxin domain-containing protein [Leptospira ainlahdjerensis]